MEAKNPDMGWGWRVRYLPHQLEDGRETVLVIWSKVGLWGPQGRDEYPACGYPEATDIWYATPKPWVRSYLNDQLVSSMQQRKRGGTSTRPSEAVALIQESHKDT